VKKIIGILVAFSLIFIGCSGKHAKVSTLGIHQHLIQEDKEVKFINVNPPFTPNYYPMRQKDRILKVWLPGYTLNDSITVGPHFIFVLVEKSKWINNVGTGE